MCQLVQGSLEGRAGQCKSPLPGAPPCCEEQERKPAVCRQVSDGLASEAEEATARAAAPAPGLPPLGTQPGRPWTKMSIRRMPACTTNTRYSMRRRTRCAQPMLMMCASPSHFKTRMPVADMSEQRPRVPPLLQWRSSTAVWHRSGRSWRSPNPPRTTHQAAADRNACRPSRSASRAWRRRSKSSTIPSSSASSSALQATLQSFSTSPAAAAATCTSGSAAAWRTRAASTLQSKRWAF